MAQNKLFITGIVLIILGVILIVIGGVLIPVLAKKVKDSVEENVKLVNGSEAFNSWKDPPAPIYLTFYFFNVTNSLDIVSYGEKPELKELGPFTYREYRDKTDIKFSQNTTQIHYREHKYYIFDRELSNYDESQIVCTINIPILTIATQLRFSREVIQRALGIALALFGERLFQCHSVKELLWGYTPKVVNEINNILADFGIRYRVNFTFGIYSGPTANGTDYGELDIYSGVGKIENLGLVKNWKGNSTVPYWHGSCNMINGSDGTLWHPFVEEKDTLYVFNTDLCRSVYLTYNGTAVVSSSNINTYHFTPPPSVMADPHTNQDNLCFCSPYDASGAYCLGAGVLNVSVCRSDAPIIMSEPHFYEAPEYQSKVSGLNPDPAKHQTFLNVEPTTGLVLNASKRIQVNMYVTKLDGLMDTEMIENGIIFPISWVDEHAVIPDDVAAKFYRTVIVPMEVADGIKYGLIALGGFILLCAIILLVVIVVKRRREAQELSTNNDDEPLLTDGDS